MVLTIAGLNVQAQLSTDADWKRQVYETEFSFGLQGHTSGYAVNFRAQKFVDGFNKRGLEIELSKIKHPKEVSSASSRSQTRARGYVFGRKNSLFTLRAGLQNEKIVFDKTDRGTVSINWLYSGGLSLGLLKPIYVQLDSQPSGGEILVERYNHVKHLSSTIIGEANFFNGIGETKIWPGLYLKSGFSFDYNDSDARLSTIELGAIWDLFFKEVPIFYEDAATGDINKMAFFQLYISINFGYRKN